MNSKESNASQQKTFDVYIGGLPKDIKQDDIKQFFVKYGEVCGVLCRYRKEDLGYGIVKFKYKQDAERVLQDLNAVFIKGYCMEVKCAKRNNQSLKNGNEASTVYQMNSCFFPETKQSNFHIGRFAHPEFVQVPNGPGSCNFNSAINPPQVPGVMEVVCTNVEDAVTFYGFPVSRAQELQNMSANLNNICNKLPRLKKKPFVREVYAAIFLEDLAWYRCCVVRNIIPSKPNMCTVFYIDFGNMEDINYQNLVELPEELRTIPMFSAKYVLLNLLPNSKLESNVSYLHHLVNQRISLYGYFLPNIPEYHVLKCSCNGIDVISEIVKKGFASYKTESYRVCTTKPQVTFKAESPKEKAGAKSVKVMQKAADGRTPSNEPQKQTSKKDKKSKSIQNCDSGHKSNESSNSKETKLVLQKNELNNNLMPKNDVVPKKIIKRGSELNDLSVDVNHEANYVKHCLVKPFQVDTVISNLKLINNIRDLVSLSNDNGIINDAFTLLIREMNEETSAASLSHAHKPIEDYMDSLNKIRDCKNMSLLPSLKSERDSCKNVLLKDLKKCLENFDTHVLERRNAIQKMITDLESSTNAWMNVYLDSSPETVEDLIKEYKKTKEQRKSFIQKAREKTNEKHKCFLEFLEAFQKEFYLNVHDECKSSPDGLENTRKEVSWSKKFEEALSDLGKAIEEEIEACTVNRRNTSISVIQCILNKLDIPKEKIDAVHHAYENICVVYNEVCKLPDLESAFSELTKIQEKINKLSLQISSCRTSEQADISNVLSELHRTLLEKDNIMEKIAKAYQSHFPELNMEHSELLLSEYCSFAYLLKHGWKPEYFLHTRECIRVESSYISQFMEDPVVIKEYVLENNEKKSSFLQKVVAWNGIKSNNLAKIKVLFYKDEKTVCALMQPVFSTLLDKPCVPFPTESENACQMLRQVLVGLNDIHSRGLVHGAVHPLTVLCEKGNVVLDFYFDAKSGSDKPSIKGINFEISKHEQKCESTDMYGFGCLVLWVLFPNLSFTATDKGTPNIKAFKSIVEELLSAKDYNLLSALLDAKIEMRPSAGMLLSSGFLKDFGLQHKSRSNVNS